MSQGEAIRFNCLGRDELLLKHRLYLSQESPANVLSAGIFFFQVCFKMFHILFNPCQTICLIVRDRLWQILNDGVKIQKDVDWFGRNFQHQGLQMPVVHLAESGNRLALPGIFPSLSIVSLIYPFSSSWITFCRWMGC